MPTKYTITDNFSDPGWVKTISPFSNTTVPGEAIQYNTSDAAQADITNVLIPIYGSTRFHVGTHPKPH
jgi:hypothetical protein